MSTDIFIQPSYQLFRKAVSEHIAPLVIVVGSGLSTDANLPDWKTLRKFIQEKIDDKYRSSKSIGTPFNTGLYQQAIQTKNYWTFFKLAKTLLTDVTFTDLIKAELDPKIINVPSSYKSLFRLNPKGVVTLNLDRLSGKALSELHPGEHFIPIYGTELTRKWSLINDERPYLVYLHGHVTDSTTWVLDQDELSRLTRSPAHSLFLSTLYLNNTVLFAGVSANDIALSGALLALNRDGFRPSRLFWLTSRNDVTVERWARENRVQLIHYAAQTNSDHEKVILDISSDLGKYRSIDIDRPDPFVIQTRDFSNVTTINMSPREVANLEPDEVRKHLSNELKKFLRGTTGEDTYNRFMQFSERYNFAIQTKSFYRHNAHGENVFFDYELNFPPLGTGNFGTVYQAKAKDGSFCAVKIMHSNIMHTQEMLGGFRRGSSSMRILSQHRVDGIVPIIESFEMPPTIVMEHVPGNSIEELFSIVLSISWETRVNILYDVSNIVDKCHKLPEMVLHRDIKPSNIMIRGLDWTDYTYEKVVVLDFDMSWHKGSSEKDVVFESRDDFGYLAPEQTDPAQAVTARSAKVDSYGLGMTAYALLKGKHPIPNMPLSEKWAETVQQTTRHGYNGPWRCLPRRMARLIVDATQIDQENRLEFGSMRTRLEKIADVARSPNSEAPIDVFAEEIVAAIASGREYIWDDVHDTGDITFGDGTKVSLELNGEINSLIVKIEYLDKGNREYQNRKTLLGNCKDQIETWLREGENTLLSSSIDGGYLAISGKVAIISTIEQVNTLVDRIEKGIRFLHQIT